MDSRKPPPQGIHEAIKPVSYTHLDVYKRQERTTFYPTVRETATTFGLTIRADAHPEAGHYYRSDHFSMARVGVPAFSVGEGLKFKGHDEAWGEAQAKDYVDHHYHQPSDEYRPDMDFTGLAQMARFGLMLGRSAAMAPELQGWQPGDEFEPARKKSLSAAVVDPKLFADLPALRVAY